MGEGRESREGESRIEAPLELDGIRIEPLAEGIALYLRPLRAPAAAFMLALFGIACSVIALASMAGLARSGETAAASMLALAFAGVFALPLFAVGQFFIAIALWNAANSLRVEVNAQGIKTERRWLGYPLARRILARADIHAVESRFAARFLSVFSRTRYYRLFATVRGVARPVLIADSLHGPEVTEEVRRLVIEYLQSPALGDTGVQAHRSQENEA